MKNRTPKALPSQSELRRLFRYDAETGFLFWSKRPLSDFANKKAFGVWNSHYSNKPAGSKYGCRYLRVAVNSNSYRAHRLIWVWNFGEIADGFQIDHIDGNCLNNKLANLRLVTHAANMRNTKLYSCNTSGFKGVSWAMGAQKWRTQVSLNGKTHRLGNFSEIKDAVEAVASFYRDNGFSDRHAGQ